MKSHLQTWKTWALGLKTEIYALYLAYKDPRTPLHARIFAAMVLGYALSPIDLIPDPIPLLGYLDDLVLLPLGVFIALKLIPPEVMTESRVKAKDMLAQGLPVNKVAAVLIILVWVGGIVILGFLLYRTVKPGG
jgi:uncharacterized membrane protein YkvA (DUF1232 family)